MDINFSYSELAKMLDELANNNCEYEWDELEEIITDCFEEGVISSEENDELMKKLMDTEC